MTSPLWRVALLPGWRIRSDVDGLDAGDQHVQIDLLVREVPLPERERGQQVLADPELAAIVLGG